MKLKQFLQEWLDEEENPEQNDGGVENGQRDGR